MGEEIIEILKEDIQNKFGKEIRYGKDCNELSEVILDNTKRQVSTSTLKRFFGIIDSPFKPSRYTLDTLAIFLGFNDWHAYLNCFDETKHHSHQPTTWELLKKRVQLVTDNSLRSLKLKTGYHHPDNFLFRDFLKKRIDSFVEAPETATMLVAPDGYGKSSCLIKLVENYFCAPDSPYKNDIVCLIDGGIFFSLYSNNSQIELLHQLLEFNVQTSLGHYFLQNPQQLKGRIWIIIDDVDEIFFEKEKYHQFAENLMRLILYNRENNWYKLILTCRPENLDIFNHLIQKHPLFKSCWFGVNFGGDKMIESINIPLYRKKEIKSLLKSSHIQPSYDFLNFHNNGLMDMMHYPTLLTSFIGKFNNSGNLSEIELLNRFVSKKLFTYPLREEKLQLVENFITLCNSGLNSVSVRKDDLLDNKELIGAYRELISQGIFYEYIIPEGFWDQHIYVRFSQNMVLEFILINKWMKNRKPDLTLLQEINEFYSSNTQLQCRLMQLFVKFLFHEKNYELIKQLHTRMETSIDFPYQSSRQLPACITSMEAEIRRLVRNNKQAQKTLIPWFAQSKLGQLLYFQETFDMDDLMDYSDENLEVYLKHTGTSSARAFVYYLRFMQGLFALDENKCLTEYKNTQQLDCSDFEVPLFAGYYFAVRILYQSIFEHKTDAAVLNEILSYSNRLLNQEVSNLSSFPQFEISVVYRYNLCDKFDEVLQLVRFIEDHYDLNPANVNCFTQLYQFCHARALLHTGEEEKALHIYKNMDPIRFPFHMKNYLQLNADLIRADFLFYRKKTKKLRKLVEEMKSLSTILKFDYFYKRAELIEQKLSAAPDHQHQDQNDE
ncbi:MAG: hypothetical protein AB7U05_13300 [Mangrovibacterium sp.]